MPNQHQVYVSKAYDHEQTITLLLDKLEELDHVELVGRGSAIPNVIRVAE